MSWRDTFSSLLSVSEIPKDLNPFVEADKTASGGCKQGPGIDDDFVFKIDKISADQPYVVDTTNKTVTIDPERVDWDEGKQELKQRWEENERAFSEKAFDLYLSIQVNKEGVDEVCSFFEPPLLSDIQYRMLKEAYHTSLYLDNFEVSKNEKDRRRGQLAERYDQGAMNVPSLCSAGYFEKGSLFRDIRDQIEEQDDNTSYQTLFDELIRKRPFVVFVRDTYTAQEVYDMIITKSIHLDDLDVDIGYIHVRGIGEYTHETIDAAITILDSNHEGVKYMKDSRRTGNGALERIVGIDNDTI